VVQKLIITCDDCGLSEGINEATLDLHQREIATAAAIITNFPASYHAYKLFSQYPSLECGIHLNLTDGIPHSKIPSPSPLTLTNGHFRPKWALFAQALHPSSSFIQLVEMELTAQIEHYLQSGLTANHLTTHLHFHIFPSLRSIIFNLAEKFKIAWVRAHRLSSTILPFNPFYRRHTPPISRVDLQPDYLIPILFWLKINPKRFYERLSALDGSIEIVIHPSTAQDKSFPKGVPYLPGKRFQEMQYLEQVMTLLG